MRKACFTEHQIAAVLTFVEAGRTMKPAYLKPVTTTGKRNMVDRSQRHKKRKDRKKENRRLKQMFANLSLENWVLKDVVEKILKPVLTRELAGYLVQALALSIRQARRALSLKRTVYCYRTNKIQTFIVSLTRQSAHV